MCYIISIIATFKTDLVANGPLWMWGDNAVTGKSSGAEAPVGWRASSKMLTASFYNNGHFYAESKGNYADNQWHTIAQVGDVDKGYIYVDGEQIASTTAGYVYTVKPFLLIGTRTKNSGNDIDDVEYFKGTIDQVAVYGVALSKDDIKSLFVGQASTVSTSGKLVSTWGEIKGN